MKIAFVLSYFPAFSETFILNQITGLLDRGHQVDIFAFRSNKDPKVHAEIEQYSLLDRTYYRSGASNTVKRFAQGAALITKNLHSKPRAIFEALNVFRFGRDALTLRQLYEVAPFLRNATYDIIQCHYGSNGNLALWLRDIGAIEGKLVVAFHGFDISYSLRKSGKNLYCKLFKEGDLFLPISDYFRERLIGLGCDEQKIVIHKMGVDPHRFKYLSRNTRTSVNLQVLSVARLVEKKGLSFGIQAVAKVLQTHPCVEYKIVGEGYLRNDLTGLIKKLGVGHRVRLLGWQNQQEVVTMMQEADIFLAPSVTDQFGNEEGIPVVLMEAMARGLPVVSTRHSGIPELVQDNRTGYLAPERDVDALAEKLAYLIENHELRQAMGFAGRRFVESHHDINNLNDQLVELYKRLLIGTVSDQ